MIQIKIQKIQRRDHMGILLNGTWQDEADLDTDKQGQFQRAASSFRDQISQEGKFKAEPNRYHLYFSYACPWASRTLIMWTLKGLKRIISCSTVDPLMGKDGWSFLESNDALNHAKYLREIYTAAKKNYSGRVTVPVLWDKQEKTIVNNESAEIMRMLNSEFNAFSSTNYDYYPENLRQEIDTINQFVYDNINNGVYKCGFAKSQTAYNEAFDNLFAALDKIEERLAKQRYLVSQLTEADWRLFTTLIRFDVVYVGHFKCNLRRIEDYPHLSKYLHDLYHVPGIKETVNFDHIKKHYYQSHIKINPTGIIPKGPEINLGKTECQ
jgi:putative glutathione S-transferase